MWESVAQAWAIRPDTCYLNHGSFGPAPSAVRQSRAMWQERLESQPMDFYVRQFEPAWLDARQRLASFVNADPRDLAFVENATAGMNVVARSVSLNSGDQVLLTDHEYGAVRKIWQAACARSGAELHAVRLPDPLESPQQVTDAIAAALTDRTRLLVVSHITSATALILPVAAICQAAHAADVLVCIDGPHAPLQVPIDLGRLGCDFYTASCHKWLCAPLGSGFLFVSREQQPEIVPNEISWGRLLPAEPHAWYEHMMWSGTRDPSAYLAVPAAIDFFAQYGIDAVRQELFRKAAEAKELLSCLTVGTSLATDPSFHGAMAHLPLPAGDTQQLQQQLWTRFHIEVPIVAWQDRRFVRVSTHLYNTREQVEYLRSALQQLL